MNSKQAAINVAKQVANESNEILKTAKEQITYTTPNQNEATSSKPKEEQEKPKPRNLSFLNDYKNELEEIGRENLYKELQRKISEGEEIPLGDFANQLSSYQREVLKAQMEAAKSQKEAAKAHESETPLQIISKRGRGIINTVSQRNKQHVEMRQPPSG